MLEASSFGHVILDLAAQKGGWTGTATELFELVAERVDGPLRLGLPKSPQGMRTALSRLKPNLRHAGVSVTFTREGKQGTRTIRIQGAAKGVSTVSGVSGEAA